MYRSLLPLQMPSVTQNMNMPGSNTSGYQSQKPGNTAGGNTYYSTGYDDLTGGHTDYNKLYTSGKQSNSKLPSCAGKP